MRGKEVNYMDRKWNFWVLGGDLRQVWLSRLLAEEGHTVFTYGMEDAVKPSGRLFVESQLQGVEQADCVLFPMPVTDGQGILTAPLSGGQHPFLPILDRLSPAQAVFGGRVTPILMSLAQERGIDLKDYFHREELAVANAVPTAEGCLQIAMERLPITLHSAQVLVIGFGRVGRVVADRLRALGAHVTIAARRCDARTWAENWGCEAQALPLDPYSLSRYDLVVNTVPALVLGEEALSGLKEDCLVIDLASRPGGVDFTAADKLGRAAVHALSLPGKVAPATAGAAIKNTVCNMLRELGV